MAVKFTTTKKAGKYAKVLVYSKSGMGKTTLIATLPNPIIISTEKKLKALKKHNIPVLEIDTLADLQEAVDFCESRQADKYEWVCCDSVTDIAQSVLADLKRKYQDPRQAYGELADEVGDALRRLRDIKGKNLYCIAKAKRVKEDGLEVFYPNMPGQQLLNELPYFFDFVFALRIEEDDDGKVVRYLQTQPDYAYDAKSCGDELNEHEPPHLGNIFIKAAGKTKKK